MGGSLAPALLLAMAAVACGASAQTPGPTAPDWAYPDTPTHHQVAPPLDFHRPPRVIDTPVGLFDGQADVGAALAPGHASYSHGKYTITSAGYNIWYSRDEFRFLWKRMSGDVSLAADIAYPNPAGYGDRKAVLIIRQSLDDDAPEALAAEHGGGMVHLAERPAKGARIRDMEYRIGSRGALAGGSSPDDLVTLKPKRIGIEKHDDDFTLWISEEGEPMHPFGPPMTLHLTAPFYVGIGFVSHLPTTLDTAVLSNVVLENRAGRMR